MWWHQFYGWSVFHHQLNRHKQRKYFLMGDNDPFTLHSQYHVCLRPRYTRDHGIGNQANDLVILEYSWFSPGRVNTCYAENWCLVPCTFAEPGGFILWLLVTIDQITTASHTRTLQVQVENRGKKWNSWGCFCGIKVFLFSFCLIVWSAEGDRSPKLWSSIIQL